MGSGVEIYCIGVTDAVRETIEMTGFQHSVIMLDTYDATRSRTSRWLLCRPGIAMASYGQSWQTTGRYGWDQLTGVTMEDLSVPGTLDSLAVIREYVKAAADEAGLDGRRAYRLQLAVDEIATNIVNHGYSEAGITGSVRIQPK